MRTGNWQLFKLSEKKNVGQQTNLNRGSRSRTQSIISQPNPYFTYCKNAPHITFPTTAKPNSHHHYIQNQKRYKVLNNQSINLSNYS